jgi:uncharacterized protein YfcZ (UPF0381/DUF406 family)
MTVYLRLFMTFIGLLVFLSACQLWPGYSNRQNQQRNERSQEQPSPVSYSFETSAVDLSTIVTSGDDLSLLSAFSKETSALEIMIAHYTSSTKDLILETVEIRNALHEDWILITATTISKSGAGVLNPNHIVVFGDKEVGVFSYERPREGKTFYGDAYFLTLDGGLTWHVWKPAEDWNPYLGYPRVGDFSMTSDGYGEIVIYSNHKPSYTFTTIDKGLTWQLAVNPE